MRKLLVFLAESEALRVPATCPTHKVRDADWWG